MSWPTIDRSLLPENAEFVAGGSLQVGGVDLLDLARRHGTPLFVYDEDHLRARCREARQAWDEGVAYATKAFLCTAMARLAVEEGLSLDVSTGGELHVALRAGVPSEKIVLHGNNKDAAELGAALEAGVGRIVVDSFDEVERLESLLDGRQVGVLVRVTPGVEAHTHEFVRTGQEDSKFGFGLASGAAAEAVARLRATDRVELVGIHAHIGSQVFRVESFAEEVEVLADFFTPLGLPGLCVGGGLGVAYISSENAPSIGQWAHAVRAACVDAGIPAQTTV